MCFSHFRTGIEIEVRNFENERERERRKEGKKERKNDPPSSSLREKEAGLLRRTADPEE